MNSFDTCQFDPRFQPKATYKRTTERRLEFSTSLQIANRQGHRCAAKYVPAAAYSEQTLRRIITAKIWAYITYGHVRKVVATLPNDIGWRELEAQSLETFWKGTWQPEHVYAVLKCGSPAE